MARPREDIIDDFVENWELEIRAGYTPPDELLDDLTERFGGLLYGDEDVEIEDDPALHGALADHTRRVLDAQRADEQRWDGPTDNDRLAAAFADLRGRGLIALENAGLTIQDGWARAAVSRELRDRGVVFFHQEDVFDALHGHSLLLAFGGFDGVDIGTEVVEALQARGLAIRWDGSGERRIELAPFAWRKRRWTAAPALPVARRDWSPTAPALRSQPLLAEHLVWERVAQRTCRGFDTWVSRGVRGAWHASGGERGQAAHRGRPHQFLAAGELARFVPRDAFDNVCVEAEAYLRD